MASTDADERIRGTVAQILSTRELVINRGAADGVTVGLKFAVLDPDTSHIVDPETGDNLGELFRPKVRVEVTRVEDRFAVARTYRNWRVNVGGRGDAALLTIQDYFRPPQYVTKFETFRSEDAAWEPLSEEDSFVKVGDPVEQILPGEDDESPPEP